VSDYGQGLARTSRLFLAQMEGGTSPDVMAEAIYRAATEDGPLHCAGGERCGCAGSGAGARNAR
jgi:hypothetical protein